MSKIAKNIGWLVFDKVFILVLQFFIGIRIANYYGSQLFGKYNYILTIVSFSSIFFEIINIRVVKRYFMNQNYPHIIFNTTFFRQVFAMILLLFAIISKTVIRMSLLSYAMLIFLCIDNLLMVSTMGIESYYEYKLDLKKIVLSTNVVKFVSYILQFVGILLGVSIVMIPIIRCFGSLIRLLLLKYFYFRDYKIHYRNRLDCKLIYDIIKESFYLWSAFIAVLLYTQLDKIMLGRLLGEKEVGVYSIGVQLSQVFAILIPPIQTSLYSKMLDLYGKDYCQYLKFFMKSNYLLTQLYLWGAIVSIFVVKQVFPFLFLKEYGLAVYVYAVLTISILLKANAALQTSHITLKNIAKYSFYKTLAGLFINVFLNYVLIKKYNVLGAAIATSITQIFTLFILDFFIPQYREHAYIQLKSFNPFYIFVMIKRQKGENNV